jgi:hypothetical protein
MKSTSLLSLMTLLLLMSCLDREVIEIAKPDPPFTNTWCDNNRTTYHFAPDGLFTMQATTGESWGGHWSYAPNSADIEINLRYGPDKTIQIIHLGDIQYDATELTARWSDEISRNIPLFWKPCSNIPSLKR